MHVIDRSVLVTSLWLLLLSLPRRTSSWTGSLCIPMSWSGCVASYLISRILSDRWWLRFKKSVNRAGTTVYCVNDPMILWQLIHLSQCIALAEDRADRAYRWPRVCGWGGQVQDVRAALGMKAVMLTCWVVLASRRNVKLSKRTARPTGMLYGVGHLLK